jgi:hypothetical protein
MLPDLVLNELWMYDNSVTSNAVVLRFELNYPRIKINPINEIKWFTSLSSDMIFRNLVHLTIIDGGQENYIFKSTLFPMLQKVNLEFMNPGKSYVLRIVGLPNLTMSIKTINPVVVNIFDKIHSLYITVYDNNSVTFNEHKFPYVKYMYQIHDFLPFPIGTTHIENLTIKSADRYPITIDGYIAIQNLTLVKSVCNIVRKEIFNVMKCLTFKKCDPCLSRCHAQKWFQSIKEPNETDLKILCKSLDVSCKLCAKLCDSYVDLGGKVKFNAIQSSKKKIVCRQADDALPS